ncbi:MAG: DUF551 domain-containing protein [Faecousia sp.]
MNKEEAIKFLSKYVDNECYTPQCKEAHQMAITALLEQEERRWIPVTERFPECGKRVLATDGGFVGEFYINKRGQWKRYNVNDYSLLMALDILFWMPLPEPPKGE